MLRYLMAPIALSLFSSCATAPDSAEDRTELVQEAESAVNDVQYQAPEVADILRDAYGFAVFPKVDKGALVVGGAYGKGVVYEQGTIVGYADVSQASAGLQAGAQRFTEYVVFEDAHAMERFKRDEFALDARASAVAIEAGAGATNLFRDGIAVFTLDEKGLMLEAAVGGQRFRFIPLER